MVLRGNWNKKNGLWEREKQVGNLDLNPDAGGTLNELAPLNPDPFNPTHYVRYHDPKGNMTRAILDGNGLPWIPGSDVMVTGCSLCPTGSPNPWVLQGFDRLV